MNQEGMCIICREWKTVDEHNICAVCSSIDPALLDIRTMDNPGDFDEDIDTDNFSKSHKKSHSGSVGSQ